jgi:hypothetical protein
LSRRASNRRPGPFARPASHAGLLCGLLLWPVLAWSAHPLHTEDTGTHGVGTFELESGLMRYSGSGQSVTAYSPQVTYGLLPTLDLIVQPSWLRIKDAAGSTLRGVGDTNLDVKWLFDGSAPFSLGVRAGVAVPTGRPGLGLRRGTLGGHATLVLTHERQPFTVHSNIGYSRMPASEDQRSELTHLSSALVWTPNEHLALTLEASADTNPDRVGGRRLTTALAGLIYTLRPGLDVDVGYQCNVPGTPPGRAWLLGLTWRFAL